ARHKSSAFQILLSEYLSEYHIVVLLRLGFAGVTIATVNVAQYYSVARYPHHSLSNTNNA
ncbi:hypothetical protein COCC4DRAFT_30575, partial [Bipolaris maydis ATCC 48331]